MTVQYVPPIQSPDFARRAGNAINALLQRKRLIDTTTASLTIDGKEAERDIILANATSGAITITLPPADPYKGVAFTIKKTDATNNVTIDGDGSETINGAATYVLTTQHEVVTVVSDGSGWHII